MQLNLHTFCLFALITALGTAQSFEGVPLPLVKRVLPQRGNDSAIDIVILVDESASLSQEDFRSAITVCENLLKQFGAADARFAFIAFATKARLVVPFTTDREEVLKGLQSIFTRDSLATNPTAGFEEAKLLFNNFARPSAKRVLFWPTDAKYSSERVPASIASTLKFSEHVTIFGVGLGDHDPRVLESVSSHGYSFHQSDFHKALSALTEVTKEKEEKPTRELVIVPYLEKSPLNVKEGIQLKLRLKNEGREVIPAGSLIKFTAGDFLVKDNVKIQQAIHPQQQIDLNIHLAVTAEANFKTLPEFIDMSIVDPNDSPIFTEHDRIRLSTEHLVGSLVNWQSPDPDIPVANVLLFGCIGAGKSSLINSVLTSLSSEVQQTAVVGGSEDHVTSTLARFRLWNIPGIPKVRVNLWDTWGLTATNYHSEFVKLLLRGAFANGFHMKERFVLREAIEHDLALGNVGERSMHAALVVVPQGITADSNLATSMKAAFKDMGEHGLNPVVVVTHIDERSPEEYPSLRKQIADLFRISENRIYLVQNYVTQAEKNFTIDRNSLVVLEEVIKLANQRIALLKSNHDATIAHLEGDVADSKASKGNAEATPTTRSFDEPSREMKLVAGMSLLLAAFVGILFVGIRLGRRNSPAYPSSPDRSRSRSRSRGRSRSRSSSPRKPQPIAKTVEEEVEVEEEEEEAEETKEESRESDEDDGNGWEFVETEGSEEPPLEPSEPATEQEEVQAEVEAKADVEVKFNFLSKIFEVKEESTVADLLDAAVSYYCIPDSMRDDYHLVDQYGNTTELSEKVYDPLDTPVYCLQRRGGNHED